MSRRKTSFNITEAVAEDPRKCPCGHRHPGGMGLAMCMCKDCGLLWFAEPEYLAPAFRARYDELMALQEAAS